jgi:hypothetical protein
MIDKAFLGFGLNKNVCLRIQKYILLYTECKTQMQNESQEFREILLHLILNGGLAELHDVAVRPQIGYIFHRSHISSRKAGCSHGEQPAFLLE